MGGAANWRETAGVITMRCPGSPEIVVRMNEYGRRRQQGLSRARIA